MVPLVFNPPEGPPYTPGPCFRAGFRVSSSAAASFFRQSPQNPLTDGGEGGMLNPHRTHGNTDRVIAEEGFP